MVKILNPSRLTKVIEFGSDGEVEYDANDRPISTFKTLWKTTAIPWSLTMPQMIQAQGANLTNQLIFAVRHRDVKFWQDVSLAKLSGVKYEVINVNPDSSNSPTSYDLITLKKVAKHD